VLFENVIFKNTFKYCKNRNLASFFFFFFFLKKKKVIPNDLDFCDLVQNRNFYLQNGNAKHTLTVSSFRKERLLKVKANCFAIHVLVSSLGCIET
jgi:hypothetical protein